MFGIPLIADKKLDFIEASKKSIETVRPEIVMYILFSLAISFIASAGALLFVIGIFFTIPFNVCAIAVAYKDVFGIENKPTKKPAKKEPGKKEEGKKEEEQKKPEQKKETKKTETKKRKKKKTEKAEEEE